jgi:hypothetical protein
MRYGAAGSLHDPRRREEAGDEVLPQQLAQARWILADRSA